MILTLYFMYSNDANYFIESGRDIVSNRGGLGNLHCAHCNRGLRK